MNRAACFKLALAATALVSMLAVPAFGPAFAQQDPFNLDPGDPNRPQPPHNDQPPPDNPPPSQGCTETFTYNQPMPGVLALSVTSPCRHDVPLVFNVQGHEFHTAFDTSGRAAAVVPLFQAFTHITWSDAAGKEQAVDVDFSNYDTTVQIVLVWDDPIDLDLRLVEPKGPPAGNVYAAKPNLDFSNGYGVLARIDNGQMPGAHAEVYVLTKDRNPVLNGTLPRGVIAQKIDYVTREAVRKGDYCDGGPLAAPYFTVYRNVYGRAEKPDKKRFGALACVALNQNGDRLFPADPPINLKPRS